MAYSDFTLEAVVKKLGVTLETGELFPGITPTTPPAWLPEALGRGRQLVLLSEKARSEFIVAPILLAARELSHNAFAIYSGQRLDVAPEQDLVGECDFILTATAAVHVLTAPIATLVEAKKADIELGLGQCAAQMIGARLFNEREGRPPLPVYG